MRTTAALLAVTLPAMAAGQSPAPQVPGPDAAVSAPPPAPAPAPAPATTPTEPPSAPLSRADAFAQFKRLFAEKQYEQAVVLAKQVVELTDPKAEHGVDELQVAHMNLAIAQFHAGDYVGAEESYLRVIELVEASGRLTNPRLARAYAGLANTYYAGKRYDLAAPRYERAIALNRRNEGLFNEEQLPLLEKQADTLTQLDRAPEALQARRYALRVVEHKYGAGSLRYARELESIGRWFARLGFYDSARAALLRAVDIVEAAEGKNSPQLVGPLTAIADCARRQLLDPKQRMMGSPDESRSLMYHDPTQPMPVEISPSTIAADGLKALERAAAISGSRPDPSPTQVADVRTQLGDWYQLRLQHDKALPQYQQAWQAASHAELGGKPLTAALFGSPALLYHDWPENWDRYRARPSTEAELRNIEIELTVTAQGRVRDPKILTDAGDPKLSEQAVRAAQSARYRPRMENGQPVDTPGVRFSQPFYVLLVPDTPAPPAGKASR